MCMAALPEDKQKIWDMLMDYSEDSQVKDWGLHSFQQTFMGFNQTNQYEHIQKFEE